MLVNNNFQKIPRIVSKVSILFLSVFFLIVWPLSAFSDNSLTVRRTTVDLTSGRITDQVILDMYLNHPEEFYISVSSPAHGGGNDRKFFYMKPVLGRGANHQVKLALDLPYEQVTPGGPYQVNTVNSVINQKHPPRLATNNYSSCRASINSYAGSRVCKPLSFLVVDMDSIPGVTYGVDLDIEITTKDHQTVLRDTIYVTYTNTSSPIGIYSTRDRLSLKPGNAFRDSSQFCVFSQAADHFDVRLEGERQNGELVLRGDHNYYLRYSADIYLNHFKHPENVKPFEWARGGRTIKARNFTGCMGQSNLEVQVSIPQNVVRESKPGHYTGVLTVRVRAL